MWIIFADRIKKLLRWSCSDPENKENRKKESERKGLSESKTHADGSKSKEEQENE